MFQKVVMVVYKSQCEKMQRDNVKISGMLKNGQNPENYDKYIVDNLECYKSEADADLLKCFEFHYIKYGVHLEQYEVYCYKLAGTWIYN